jgi:hypothetical protein
VTNSKFSTADPYSYLVCSSGPDGSWPFFKENHGSCSSQDSDAGQDAHGARAPRCRPLGSPFVSIPHSGVALGGCEPVGGPTFEPSDLNGPLGHFQPVSLLTCGGFWAPFPRVRPLRGRALPWRAHTSRWDGAMRHGERGHYGGHGSRGGGSPSVPLPITGALSPSVVTTPILSFCLLHLPAAGARAVPHLCPCPHESS